MAIDVDEGDQNWSSYVYSPNTLPAEPSIPYILIVALSSNTICISHLNLLGELLSQYYFHTIYLLKNKKKFLKKAILGETTKTMFDTLKDNLSSV